MISKNCRGGIIMPENTKKGYAIAYDGDGVYINRPHQKRGVVQKQMIQTIKTNCSDIGVVVKDDNSFVGKHYQNFYEKNGYIPEMFNPYNEAEIVDIAPTQTTQCGSTASSASVLKVEPKIEVLGNYSPSNHDASRIVSGDGLAPTVKENHGTITATIQNLRIRKLTPKECWRLMGFDDEDFGKAAQVCSNSRLYKQAGNSIVVDTLMAIFGEMI